MTLENPSGKPEEAGSYLWDSQPTKKKNPLVLEHLGHYLQSLHLVHDAWSHHHIICKVSTITPIYLGSLYRLFDWTYFQVFYHI